MDLSMIDIFVMVIIYVALGCKTSEQCVLYQLRTSRDCFLKWVHQESCSGSRLSRNKSDPKELLCLII